MLTPNLPTRVPDHQIPSIGVSYSATPIVDQPTGLPFMDVNHGHTLTKFFFSLSIEIARQSFPQTQYALTNISTIIIIHTVHSTHNHNHINLFTNTSSIFQQSSVHYIKHTSHSVRTSFIHLLLLTKVFVPVSRNSPN